MNYMDLYKRFSELLVQSKRQIHYSKLVDPGKMNAQK